MEKRKMRPIWWLIIGIAFLIIPAGVYLGFLIPAMRDEYIILMSSGGVIGGAGLFGAEMIPEKTKFGTLYKTASKSFTLLVVITLVKDFLPQILGFIIVVVISYIIFRIFKELWQNGKRERENKELAAEVASGVAEALK